MSVLPSKSEGNHLHSGTVHPRRSEICNPREPTLKAIARPERMSDFALKLRTTARRHSRCGLHLVTLPGSGQVEHPEPFERASTIDGRVLRVSHFLILPVAMLWPRLQRQVGRLYKRYVP
jgi:hypothetical protein